MSLPVTHLPVCKNRYAGIGFLKRRTFINPSAAVNTIAADVLAPWVARTSKARALTMKKVPFTDEITTTPTYHFNLTTPLSIYGMLTDSMQHLDDRHGFPLERVVLERITLRCPWYPPTDVHRQDAYKWPGPWFNIKMSSNQYRKSHCGDKTVVRSSYLYNGISYIGKMISFDWIGPLVPSRRHFITNYRADSAMTLVSHQWYYATYMSRCCLAHCLCTVKVRL